MLLTSEFEGVPYVAYEAMAMAKPIVAPDLPGLREILTAETGVLSPRAMIPMPTRTEPARWPPTLAAEASASARAQRALTSSRSSGWRRSTRRSTTRCSEPRRLSRVLAGQSVPRGPPQRRRFRLADAGAGKRPARVGDRPCFNHGRYLPGCLRSIAEQTYCADRDDRRRQRIDGPGDRSR